MPRTGTRVRKRARHPREHKNGTDCFGSPERKSVARKVPDPFPAAKCGTWTFRVTACLTLIPIFPYIWSTAMEKNFQPEESFHTSRNPRSSLKPVFSSTEVLEIKINSIEDLQIWRPWLRGYSALFSQTSWHFKLPAQGQHYILTSQQLIGTQVLPESIWGPCYFQTKSLSEPLTPGICLKDWWGLEIRMNAGFYSKVNWLDLFT